MQMDESSNKENSLKQLRLQLLELAKELNKTTKQLQLLEVHENPSQSQEDDSFGMISESIQKQDKISPEIIPAKKGIRKLDSKMILKAELVVLPILAVLLFYAIDNHSVVNSTDMPNGMKTRYLIENLQGQADNTAKYWNIARGTSLTVSIVNPGHLSEEKINVIKDAVLSTEPVYLENSLLGKSPSDVKSEYYKGWQGALGSIKDTEFPVPAQFNVVELTTGPGQIVITLSNLEDPDGYSGYTRLYVDNYQILKSFVTIYDSDKLSDYQLAAIVRHEFGHALGLPHTNDPQDLMHPVIQTSYPYISQCDVNAVQSLYDDKPVDKDCKLSYMR